MDPIDVAFVTCAARPDGEASDRCLARELQARGLSTRFAVWDDPAVDWSAARLALVRSTWDYHLRRDAFLAWADAAQRATRLWNPAALIRWNTHKAYLLELERALVPIVPTLLRRAGQRFDLARAMRERGWASAVVKPAVSLGSQGAMRVNAGDEPAGQHHLDATLSAVDALVQPYLASIEGPGERSLVFVERRYSHAVRRAPAFEPGCVVGAARRVEPDPDELALAHRALAAVPGRELYARVDVVREACGRAVVMELELVEPSLFLDQAPDAVALLATAVRDRVAD